MKIGNSAKLLLSIGVCLLAGMIGSLFTFSAIATWYASLQKPAFSPPNWVFGPVWTILYFLMGISLFLVWKKLGKKKDRKVMLGLQFFGFQLAANVLWSLLFFGLRSPFLAFIEIIALWLAILATTYQFWKIDKNAAYLLVPYLLWTSFAAVLNYSVWMLNA